MAIRRMTNRTAPGQTAADPLREIKQSVVAIGTLADPPALPSDQLFYDGSQVDFEVRGTGFRYAYTPIEFAAGKSDPGFYESTPVSMIGFPLGMMEGGRKNYPAVRAGTIAQIQGYLDGDPEHRIFLIDGSVFGGNSGGPIVVRKGTMNSEGEILSNTAMIGMVARAVHVETIRKDESSADVMENADLVNAVTMESINETIRRYYLEKRAMEKSG